MRTLIYFSGVTGMALLLVRFVGIFFDMTYDDLFFQLGLGILLAITLPLYLIENYNYRKKVRSIIEGKGIKSSGKKISSDKSSAKEEKGADYPSFREQKQGLQWGGGNVHGAGAKRGSKRKFLGNN